MLKKTVRVIVFLVLVIFIVGFAVLFTSTIVRTWDASSKQGKEHVAPQMSETTLYVATAIAGVMTSFFAAQMGVEEPEIRKDRTVADVSEIRVSFWKKFVDWVTRLGKFLNLALFMKYEQTMKLIGSVYLVIYFLLAVAAIVTWIAVPEVTPPLIKNVASISLTMFISIVKLALDSLSD